MSLGSQTKGSMGVFPAPGKGFTSLLSLYPCPSCPFAWGLETQVVPPCLAKVFWTAAPSAVPGGSREL